nr:hypothetical protein [Tanacetum cinerariifolium]
MCNREGVPKEININTLDPQNSDKQIRNTRYHITGCMARIKVNLDHVSRKYEITKFVAKHNHQLLPKEHKYLKKETKKQRKMPQAKKMNVVRASTMRLGATKAHNLYSKIKGGTQYVHGTSDDFKNHIRDVNAFIGESDKQILINAMENRKKFVPNFTFHYLVKNSELVAMFWANEVAKCNYKEFRDIIPFDFVEKLENIKKEIKVKVPYPPSQKTGDVIKDIHTIKKPKQNLVNNPQNASNKGGRRGERRKSRREIAMKAKAKRARKCGYCAKKTNKHTKTTCPLNPKYIVKLERIKAAAEQERRTAASATEQ